MLFGQMLSNNNKIFYNLFNQAADNAYEMASLLYQVVKAEHVSEENLNIKHIARLREKAMSLKTQVYATSGKAFISPFDRDDMYALVTAIDSVTHFIDISARRINIYNIRIKPEVKELAGIIVDCCNTTSKCVKSLNNLSQLDPINDCCRSIRHLEHRADDVYRMAMASLVEQETDSLEIIKYTDVYQVLERVTDKCEDVAGVIESIVIKNA